MRPKWPTFIMLEFRCTDGGRKGQLSPILIQKMCIPLTKDRTTTYKCFLLFGVKAMWCGVWLGERRWMITEPSVPTPPPQHNAIL